MPPTLEPIKIADTAKGPFSWQDESDDVYHSNGAVGSSTAKAAWRNPYLYYLLKRNQCPFSDNEAMARGRRAHMYFLEPERFASACVVRPPGLSLRTKEGRDWKEKVQGKHIVAGDEFDALEQARLTCPPEIHDLFDSTLHKREATLRGLWKGLGIQARFDLYDPVQAINYDLKRTSQFDMFDKQSYNLGMWLQAGWYSAVHGAALGTPLGATYLVVSETTAPYRWRLCSFSPAMISHGCGVADMVIDDLVERYESNQWLDYEDPACLDFPAWAPEISEEPVMEGDCVG